ncbi:MAG: hypothetical protein ACTHNU_17350 [Gaiellales bacterium]
MRPSTLVIVAVLVVLTGCSAESSPSPAPTTATTHTAPSPPPSQTPPATGQSSPPAPALHHVALVTAEHLNELVAVSLPAGRVVRRVHIAPDPTTVAAGSGYGPVVAVSPGSARVTLLSVPDLRSIAVLRHFRSPQIATVTPDGEYAMVSDAAAGTVSAIEFADGRVAGHVSVGPGAHHLAVSPDDQTAWVALGETAHTIVVFSCCTDPRHMRVLRRLHPAVAAHDLAFAPDGMTVWVTSASAPYVSVLDARSGRPIRKVPAGPAPQHIVFSGNRAYITSGYGSSIEMVDASTGRVLRRAALPYGSFNLASSGKLIVTTSLLDGWVTELRAGTLRRVVSRRVAPNARAVAVAATTRG